MEDYLVKKIVNNNVVIANGRNEQEVILIGKGIGFGKKTGDQLNHEEYEKIFTLKDQGKQLQYKRLIMEIDGEVLEIISEAINHIKTQFKLSLSENIHIALTQHIALAIKRLQQGLDIHNPFLVQTKELYSKEYAIAKEVVEIINVGLHLQLPEDEIGFVALHIHSSLKTTTN